VLQVGLYIKLALKGPSMKTDEAIKHFGSRAALAKALGISVAAISQWGDEPPKMRQFQIHTITNGALQALRHKGKINEN
jgi:DNA-binding transcriptional regulator YdaS (Cro superfamily)